MKNNPNISYIRWALVSQRTNKFVTQLGTIVNFRTRQEARDYVKLMYRINKLSKPKIVRVKLSIEIYKE